MVGSLPPRYMPYSKWLDPKVVRVVRISIITFYRKVKNKREYRGDGGRKGRK